MKYVSRVKQSELIQFQLGFHYLIFENLKKWKFHYLIFRCNKVTEFPTSDLKPQIVGWKGMEIHLS